MPCVSSCVSSVPMLLLMTSMSTGSGRLNSAVTMTAPEALLPRARAAARPRLQERFKNEVSSGAEGDWAEKLRVVLHAAGVDADEGGGGGGDGKNDAVVGEHAAEEGGQEAEVGGAELGELLGG
jgi:hypothetical protein